MKIGYCNSLGQYSYKLNADGIQKALKKMQVDHIIFTHTEIDSQKLKDFNPDFIICSTPLSHYTYLLKKKNWFTIGMDLEGVYDLKRLVYTDMHNFNLLATVDSAAKRYIEENIENHPPICHIPLGFDPDLYKPIIDKNYESSIILVGVLFDSRVKILDFLYPLKSKGYNIVVIGSWLQRIRRRDHLTKVLDIVSPEEMIKYYSNSKIILVGNRDYQPNNFTLSSSKPYYPQTCGRVYQETAVNFTMVNDDRPEIFESFERDKEIVTFSLTDGGKELRDKVKYYLDNEVERLKIKNAAMSRTLRENTWECRLFKLIDFVKANKS